MPNDAPSNEDIDKYCRELPESIVARLPDSIEQREAKRLINAAADLAHRCTREGEARMTEVTIVLPDPSALSWECRRQLREYMADGLRTHTLDDEDVGVDIVPERP